MNDQNPERFFSAIAAGDQPAVEEMLRRDPGLASARNEQCQSAVLFASYNQQPTLVDLLIQTLRASNAPLDIFEASAAGDIDTVRSLIEKDPSLANQWADDGFQPLGLASFFGHRDIVAFLLEHSAEVNSASRNDMHVMPLHSAAARPDVEIARLLVEHGADVNAKQADDFTPLHAAAQNGSMELVDLLLVHGADPTARLSDGMLPRDLARQAGHTDVAARLEGVPG